MLKYIGSIVKDDVEEEIEIAKPDPLQISSLVQFTDCLVQAL